MRALLAALALGLSCGPLHAQPKPQQYDPARPQDQRARERVPGSPPPDHRKHTVSKDAQPPKGQTSPANQFQQQRQPQQSKPGATQLAVFQCSARPACGGSYGRCSSVQQTYRGGTEESRRRDIVDDCIQANTPDTCQCAVQCRRVARCSIF